MTGAECRQLPRADPWCRFRPEEAAGGGLGAETRQNGLGENGFSCFWLIFRGGDNEAVFDSARAVIVTVTAPFQRIFHLGRPLSLSVTEIGIRPIGSHIVPSTPPSSRCWRGRAVECRPGDGPIYIYSGKAQLLDVFSDKARIFRK